MTSNDETATPDAGAPDIQGGAGHRYGDPQSGNTPVPSGAGPVAGDAEDDRGGTAAGNPLEGLIAGDDDLPKAKASEQGTPAATEVVTTHEGDQ